MNFRLPVFFCFFSILLKSQILIAQVSVETNLYEEDTVLIVEADTTEGFQHPYILYIPKGTKTNSINTLLVEPNNTGLLSDSIDVHKQAAIKIASKSSVGNNVSRILKIPFLVPIFPRPLSQPMTYTHALDRDVMLEKESNMERIDLQLIAMIGHAREQLQILKIPTHPKIFMTGFSASGTFVNRFTFIHPESIRAVATGGLNSILMLPLKKLENQKLNFPLGLNNFKEITGKSFEQEKYLKVSQFIYMGELDDNDAVKYDDAYSQQERELIYSHIGKDMAQRWERCQEIYLNNDVDVKFRTYEEVGHWTTREMSLEIIKFFQELLNEGI